MSASSIRGLLAAATRGCDDDVCVTCSDEGRPAEVLSVDDHGMAAVRTSGGVETRRHHDRRAGQRRRPRADPRRHRDRRRSAVGDRRMSRLPLPVPRRRRARRAGRCSTTSPPRPRPKRPTAMRLRADNARAGGNVDQPPPRTRWPSGSTPAGGSSRSATAAARPTPLGRRPVRRRPRRAGPLPARCLADDTAVLTALGNDVGFELVFSRQLIAHARAGDIAARSVHERQLAQPARRLPRGSPTRDPDDRLRRLRRRGDGALGATSSTASSCAPTASTASRRPRPRSRRAVGGGPGRLSRDEAVG